MGCGEARTRRALGAAALLLYSAAATAQEGAHFKRWNSVSGSTINDMMADPDYHTQLDTPDVDQFLDGANDFWETARNVCNQCAS